MLFSSVRAKAKCVSTLTWEVPLMRVRSTGLALAAVLLVSGPALAQEFKSGPQPGKGLIPFHPLNINGTASGKKNCLV
jgi:hypothetical protein